MKASIVIPTYNRGYIIAGALESALAQTYRDFEIVVLDDGSTDNTPEVVGSFHSDKIRYIRHEQNRGCSAACNSGISAAQGEFVGILDSDDIWKPDKLERQVGFLSRHPEVDAVFSDVEIHGDTGTSRSLTGLMKRFSEILGHKEKAEEYVLGGREIYLCLLEEVPIKPTAFLSRREIYETIGNFDEAWPSGTDWDLYLRFSRSCSFGYIDRPLAIQRRSSDATHLKFREKDKLFLLSVFLQERRKLKSDPEAFAAATRGIAKLYSDLGWHYLYAGQRRRSIRCYLQGFKDTWEPMMLPRAASVFMPLGLRDTLSRASKGAPLTQGWKAPGARRVP